MSVARCIMCAGGTVRSCAARSISILIALIYSVHGNSFKQIFTLAVASPTLFILFIVP